MAEGQIMECYRCGGKHDGLDFVELKGTPGVHSHWYMCPTLNEPAFCNLGEVDDAVVEVEPQYLEMIRRAASTGHFMLLTFRTADGTLTMDRRCHEFDVREYTAALELVKGDFQKDLEATIGSLLDKPQLDEAAPPKLVSMFDDGEQ